MGTGGPWGTTTDTRRPMTEDAALLTLAQWLSPGFPVGSFAWSHGLEAAISSGEVGDAAEVGAWIGAILDRGSGRADAVLLCAALDPESDPGTLDTLARALATSRERLAETTSQGTAFSETVGALTGAPHAAMALPVAVGRAARTLGLARSRVAAFYLQAVVANLVSAAVRFVPLGQTEGQRVLAGLRPIVLRVASEAAAMAPEDITSGVPGADLAAMAHETMEVRLFRS